MAETSQGAIVPASEVPNPTPDPSERATAILAWVLEHSIRVRRVDGGLIAMYRAYVAERNGTIRNVGAPAYSVIGAAEKAYDEWRIKGNS